MKFNVSFHVLINVLSYLWLFTVCNYCIDEITIVSATGEAVSGLDYQAFTVSNKFFRNAYSSLWQYFVVSRKLGR